MANFKQTKTSFCFVCLSKLHDHDDTSKKKVEICANFCDLSFRFIHLDDPVGKNETLEITGKGRPSFLCCELCLSSLETFCEIYENLLRILDKITKQMDDATASAKTRRGRRSLEEQQIFGFQRSFIENAQKKTKRREPAIKLEPNDVVTADHDFEEQTPLTPTHASDIEDEPESSSNANADNNDLQLPKAPRGHASSSESQNRSAPWTKVAPIPDAEIQKDWRIQTTNVGKNATVISYYCAHSYNSCAAKLRKRELPNGVVVFERNNADHSNHRECDYGLTFEQKLVVNDCVKNGITKPKLILDTIHSKNLLEPTRLKLVNYLKRNKTKIKADASYKNTATTTTKRASREIPISDSPEEKVCRFQLDNSIRKVKKMTTRRRPVIKIEHQDDDDSDQHTEESPKPIPETEVDDPTWSPPNSPVNVDNLNNAENEMQLQQDVVTSNISTESEPETSTAAANTDVDSELEKPPRPRRARRSSKFSKSPRKRNKAPPCLWNKVAPIPDEELKRDWRVNTRNVGKHSNVTAFYCAHFHSESNCSAKLRKRELPNGVVEFERNDVEHHHSGDRHLLGLTPEQKRLVSECIKSGISRPNYILDIFRLRRLVEPNKMKLIHYLRCYRTQIQQDESFIITPTPETKVTEIQSNYVKNEPQDSTNADHDLPHLPQQQTFRASSSSKSQNQRDYYTMVAAVSDEELQRDWRVRTTNVGKSCIVIFYYCAHSPNSCFARLRKRKLPNGVTLFERNNMDHSNHRECGLTIEQRILVDECLKTGISRPNDILETFQSKNLLEPAKMKLCNYLVCQKTKTGGVSQNSTPNTSPIIPMTEVMIKNLVLRKCFICSKVCANPSKLELHIRSHTCEKPFHCSVCSEEYSNSQGLFHHQMVNNHLPEGANGKLAKKFKWKICDICGKKFTGRRNLEKHKLVHTDERNFQCDICQKRFKSKARMMQHKMYIHCYNEGEEREKPHQCDICKRKFTFASNLRYHQRNMHPESGGFEKTFKCPYEPCPMAFFENSRLQSHIRKHTGEKPFQCEICGSAFTQKYNLNMHMENHSGASFRFLCGICGRGFRYKNDLTRHEKRHFYQGPKLKRGPKPKPKSDKPSRRFVCTLCAKSFGTRAHLRRHETAIAHLRKLEQDRTQGDSATDHSLDLNG